MAPGTRSTGCRFGLKTWARRPRWWRSARITVQRDRPSPRVQSARLPLSMGTPSGKLPGARDVMDTLYPDNCDAVTLAASQTYWLVFGEDDQAQSYRVRGGRQRDGVTGTAQGPQPAGMRRSWSGKGTQPATRQNGTPTADPISGTVCGALQISRSRGGRRLNGSQYRLTLTYQTGSGGAPSLGRSAPAA